MVASAIPLTLAIKHGLGKRRHLVHEEEVGFIQKQIYVSTMLYILAIGFSQISVTVVLLRLSKTTAHRLTVIVLRIVIVSWTVAITVGVAFQCALPRPWDTLAGECIHLVS